MAMPSGRASAWWNLSRKQKRVLQQMRRAGMFGGETAAGIGRAPYFWAQEYGNEFALIKATGNAERAWARFKQAAPDELARRGPR